MATTRRTTRPSTETGQRRTFVLDTSVLLADPRAITRFAEHEVVVPVVVIIELEAKRHHPELGYFARQSLRMLDDLRLQYGRLDAPIPIGTTGGRLRVELNHADPGVLPAGFRMGDNDSRILAVARNLAADGRHVTLVSKDLPMRVKASAVGLEAEEYEPESPVESGWTGMAEIEISADEMAELYAGQPLAVPAAHDLPCHTGLVVLSPRGSALARVTPDKQIRLVRGDRDVFGVHGRSAEQRVAIDAVAGDEGERLDDAPLVLHENPGHVGLDVEVRIDDAVVVANRLRVGAILAASQHLVTHPEAAHELQL